MIIDRNLMLRRQQSSTLTNSVNKLKTFTPLFTCSFKPCTTLWWVTVIRAKNSYFAPGYLLSNLLKTRLNVRSSL
ncbi:hypothetical protein CW304_21050 [Bacillus sp. UFRGS-B20]|nr:hypothetical protein CW304_21050 [Bacillus sp. UFRGS-B20]